MGGTCTGEHGVGVGKMQHIITEHGAGAMEVMASIKRAMDPLGMQPAPFSFSRGSLLAPSSTA